MKAFLLGGTSGMGRALGRLLMERGHDVFLAGIDDVELSKSATDFEERGGGKRKVGYAECDLTRPETFQPALDRAHAALGGFDTVIVTAGLFGTQERLEQDIEFTRLVMTVNFTNTVVFCELARKYLLSRGGGTLCAFSSVAGDRGRKPVVLYGASKAGLSAYLEGLDHRYHAEGLHTLCVKPGFVRTSMTEGLKAPPFAGEPEGVAQQVLTAIERRAPMVYTPSAWGWVMRVIRLLPRFVMRKVQF
jgi:decaprenylphospho-beta-D-erythro-pentofuranosid-2-ulose 2-reductase